MTLYSNIFKFSSYFVLLGWLILFAFPSWPLGQDLVIGVVAALLCFIYTYLIFLGKKHDDPEEKIRGSFWSLKGVMKLFQSPRLVLAGWIHYLAFDLMVGLFIVTDASQYEIAHWMLIPCLLLALMFGPAGLLLYLVLRMVVAL